MICNEMKQTKEKIRESKIGSLRMSESCKKYKTIQNQFLTSFIFNSNAFI